MADDEDIPANFLEEDNDLPEDEPVCKGRLLFYTLEQKKKTVHEVYSQPHHVRLTARKWRVHTVQICLWRIQMQADAVPPAYPYPHTVEDRTIIKDHKKLKHKMKADP